MYVANTNPSFAALTLDALDESPKLVLGKAGRGLFFLRRSGCGRRLIEAVAAAARERGCSRLYWTTKADNAIGRSLYDRIARFNGFIRYDYPLG